jgi:hypothetical protein
MNTCRLCGIELKSAGYKSTVCPDCMACPGLRELEREGALDRTSMNAAVFNLACVIRTTAREIREAIEGARRDVVSSVSDLEDLTDRRTR